MSGGAVRTITGLSLPSVVKMVVAASLCLVRNWLSPTGINGRADPSTGRARIVSPLMLTNSPPNSRSKQLNFC